MSVAVVLAKARTHNHPGVWVPAFAGTTIERAGTTGYKRPATNPLQHFGSDE